MLYGWIFPEGEYLPCDFMGHYDLAEKIMESRNLQNIRNECADDALAQRHGWVKAYTSFFDRGHVLFYCPNYKITPKQKEVLLNDYFEHPENWRGSAQIRIENLAKYDF